MRKSAVIYPRGTASIPKPSLVPNTQKMLQEELPKIKFSPFDSLSIGEKNKIVKRQPLKNTIFVTRLNKKLEEIDPRSIFDVANKRGRRRRENRTKANKQEVFCFEYEGKKAIVKNNEKVKFKFKMDDRKVKFKPEFKLRETLEEKIITKFHERRQRVNAVSTKCSVVLMDIRNTKERKMAVDKGRCDIDERKISQRQRYLTRYLHELYLRKNREALGASGVKEKPREARESPYSVEEVIGIPKANEPFDVTFSESILDEISVKFHERLCKDFKLPAPPKSLVAQNYEDDPELEDAVYQYHMKSIQFDTNRYFEDFSDSLRHAGIIESKTESKRRLRIYQKKQNEISVIFDSRFVPYTNPSKGEFLNGVVTRSKTVIDKPDTNENHLVYRKNLGCLLYRDLKGKELILGNFITPIITNSHFGKLPCTN